MMKPIPLQEPLSLSTISINRNRAMFFTIAGFLLSTQLYVEERVVPDDYADAIYRVTYQDK